MELSYTNKMISNINDFEDIDKYTNIIEIIYNNIDDFVYFSKKFDIKEIINSEPKNIKRLGLDLINIWEKKLENKNEDINNRKKKIYS